MSSTPDGATCGQTSRTRRRTDGGCNLFRFASSSAAWAHDSTHVFRPVWTRSTSDCQCGYPVNAHTGWRIDVNTRQLPLGILDIQLNETLVWRRTFCNRSLYKQFWRCYATVRLSKFQSQKQSVLGYRFIQAVLSSIPLRALPSTRWR